MKQGIQEKQQLTAVGLYSYNEPQDRHLECEGSERWVKAFQSSKSYQALEGGPGVLPGSQAECCF